MSAWTPGPWSVFVHRDLSGICIGPKYPDSAGFRDGEVQDVCTIRALVRKVSDEELANADLIARAPAMAEALTACVRAMTVATEDGGEAWNDALALARAALPAERDEKETA